MCAVQNTHTHPEGRKEGGGGGRGGAVLCGIVSKSACDVVHVHVCECACLCESFLVLVCECLSVCICLYVFVWCVDYRGGVHNGPDVTMTH